MAFSEATASGSTRRGRLTGRTSRPEPRANGPNRNRPDYREKQYRPTDRSPRERQPEGHTTDAMGTAVPETRYCGRSQGLVVQPRSATSRTLVLRQTAHADLPRCDADNKGEDDRRLTTSDTQHPIARPATNCQITFRLMQQKTEFVMENRRTRSALRVAGRGVVSPSVRRSRRLPTRHPLGAGRGHRVSWPSPDVLASRKDQEGQRREDAKREGN
jgi:hypothetical protein